MCKAFHIIYHDILLMKLAKLGFNRETIAWCSSYLSTRSQQTIANNTKSDRLAITCGVPQGSILGPLLFLIYINDIGTCLKNSKYHLYADDTVIYCSADSSMACTVRLNVDLTSLSTWCKMNKVTINTTKTKAMNFGTQKLKANKCQTKLMLNNDQVKLVPTFRYLGGFFDNCLTFSKHISKIMK